MKTTKDLEDIMKPTTMTCVECGGMLHIIPVKRDLGKGRILIETINICGKCSFNK